MRPRQADGLAEAHLAPLVSRGVVPSLAWAVVRDQEMVTGGFGGAEPRTVFQIGSVTKVFTALVLADMAERGEVHLLGQAAATPYETLVTTRICVPLGLPDTTFAVPGPRRAARGHRRGRPVPDWRGPDARPPRPRLARRTCLRRGRTARSSGTTA